MVLKPSHRMAFPDSFLLIAARTLASSQECRHTIGRQLNHEPMTVLPLASHTDGDRDRLQCQWVAQRTRAARWSRNRDFCSGHQPKPSAREIEVKIPGDRHAANPRDDEILVTRDVCSTLRLMRLRVGDHLGDQAPESIELFRASRRPGALCWVRAPVSSCPRPLQAFPGREAAPSASRSEVKRR
jgi:hypothetical protein